MKTVFAYFMAVLVGPIAIILISMRFSRIKNQHIPMMVFIETLVGGFASVCLARITFAIIGVHYDVSVVFGISIFFMLNFILGYFVNNTSYEIANVKLLGGIGCLLGVIVAGVLVN